MTYVLGNPAAGNDGWESVDESGVATAPTLVIHGTAQKRPCYPPSALMRLGATPRYVPVGQPCPANYTETPPSSVVAATTTSPSTVTTRTWPGASSTIITRPCYSQTSAPIAIPINQPCPPGTSETPFQTGTATSSAASLVGGSPTAGRLTGTIVGQRFTVGGKVPLPGGVKPSVATGTIHPASTQTTQATPAPTETPPSTPILPPQPEAPASATPQEGFFEQYKWWIVGGLALAAVGTGAYFLLREKDAPVDVERQL